jgi:hypothetical protein
MSSAASFKGHPLHPILVALPIGFWILSLVSDFIYKFGFGALVWNDVAFYTLGGHRWCASRGPSRFDRLAQHPESKIKIHRDLAHDYQFARRRALLHELLAAHAPRARRHTSDCPFCRRGRAHRHLRLAWRGAGLRSRRGGETATRSEHLISRRRLSILPECKKYNRRGDCAISPAGKSAICSPSFANRRAAARPTPAEAPVITFTLLVLFIR